MKKYFEQFGEILEAVVITDKITGKSKGYGFVTFREAEAAARACVDAAPVIDGRRANCNLASLGGHRSKASSSGGRSTRVLTGFYPRGFPISTSPVANFPGYSIQESIPYSPIYGYSPYSTEYPYPVGYCGLYGGASGQYPLYAYGTHNGLVSSGLYYSYPNLSNGATIGTQEFHGGPGYGFSYHPRHFFRYSANNMVAIRPLDQATPVSTTCYIPL